MREKTVCFTGHRAFRANDVLVAEAQLDLVLRDLISKGYTDFAAGGAMGFDMLAEWTVLKLKKEYPHIKLHLILPCRDQTNGWNWMNLRAYEDILNRADDYIYTSEMYVRGCMHKRNRYLVDMSSVCVCYLKKKEGGTAYTVDYALKNGLEVINLAKKEEDERKDEEEKKEATEKEKKEDEAADFEFLLMSL